MTSKPEDLSAATEATEYTVDTDHEEGNPGTQAVMFNPFEDDDDQPEVDLNDPQLANLIRDLDHLPYYPGGVTDTEATGHRSADEEPMATSAVPFDPFADDDEMGTSAVPFDPFADDDDAIVPTAPAQPEDVGTRARNEAISTFRKRRSHERESRAVANGMVNLPFIPISSEGLPLKDPSESKAEPPVLQPGDVVAEQYEIAGVIAHGGMGWIYVANDRNVSGRTVVLKGMMDKGNDHDYGAAVAEREFLADITHPGIVKSYNFIDDPRVPGGLIVMEYAPGPSLRELRKEQESGLLSIDIAIGYILEVLPALNYLHARGVVYNDLKPDNIIATEDQVKLIDLGAVSGIGAYGYIYGTKGFQAPEVSTMGPSVASDIYTVGRTLASLTVNLPIEDGAYTPGLPSPAEEPLFAQNMSFYRVLRRATEPDPADRFSSIHELETQLYGVLREFLAVRDAKQFPAQHSLFSPQRSTFGTKHVVFRTDQLIDGIERQVRITSPEIVAALPVPLLDRDDPGAVMISGSSYTEPSEALETMRQAMTQEEFHQSKEIPLGVVRSLLDLGFTSEARSWLNTLEPKLGADWRFRWYSGVTSLLLDDFSSAQYDFNEVFSILPGEAAPKLARAAVSEMILQAQGVQETPLLDPDTAAAALSLKGEMVESMAGLWSQLTQDPVALRYKTIYLYSLVWKTNPTTVSSAFGLARQLMAERQVELAISVLDQVPQSSRHHRMAQLTSILHLIAEDLSESRVRRAARRLDEIPTNDPRFLQIRIAILNAGLSWLRDSQLQQAASPNELFEYPFSQDGLRTGLYETLRMLARATPNAKHRYQLVDMANQVRPTTWF